MTDRPTETAAGPDDLAERLRSAAARSAERNLEPIREALGRPPADDLDDALVGALSTTGDVDRVLEQVDLEALGALADRLAARLEPGRSDPEGRLRRAAWDLLDRLRRPAVLRRVAAAGGTDEWSDRFLRLVERSRLTVGPLFRHRAETYGAKTLFEHPTASGPRSMTWRQARNRVEILSRGLLALDDEPGPVAILSENRLEMALVDLACLTAGIVDVMIPANATAADVGYMLRHAAVRTAVVSGGDQLRKVLEHVGGDDPPPALRHVISMDAPERRVKQVRTLDEVVSRAPETPAARPAERASAVGIDDLASVMYTSGTTGKPKGIQFSHRNVVFKRFARALAIPEIGEGDVFLAYLPLCHTFGRYLEMLGCVFWGARYCFLLNPAVEALIRGMRRYRPTVFISVPKKWIELYEAIRERADPLEAPDDEQRAAVESVTGGRLRWGLSAAGHLDPEIFRFFQHHGVELMSGFGMTEGTGGITMTPPGGYKDDSLGLPLPGIECRLDEDGELMVRGPYVMTGYLDPPDGETVFDEAGWFRTGDLMEKDADGHLRLVDRKKEIYKNIKGETIAPQRVENLFRDFASVRRVFLVGDHRPYNTVLIHPDPDYKDLDLAALPAEELREHLRSIVVSVNKFLSPFERIVDFAVIDRDLDPGRGELTAKGTPRRRVVERNFSETIHGLYRRTRLHVGGVDVVFPNWLFQRLGLTAKDIEVGEQTIAIRGTGRSLTIKRRRRGQVQVGAYLYHHRHGALNLGSLLTSPAAWLGNEELVGFVPLDLPALTRSVRDERTPEWSIRKALYVMPDEQRARLGKLEHEPALDLMDAHLLTLALASERRQDSLDAVTVLSKILTGTKNPLLDTARLILARTAVHPSVEARRMAFQVLAPVEQDSRFPRTLRRFLSSPGVLLDGETRAVLVEHDLSDAKIDAFVRAAREAAGEPSSEGPHHAVPLLHFLAEYGAAHPVRYRRLRAFLTRMMLFAAQEPVRLEAARAADALTKGFRQWLGPTSRIAVDEETAREYRWADVAVFDDEIDRDSRARLIATLKTSSMLREGVFMFSGGASVRLSDIPPGGVWVRPIGERHGRSVQRVTVQTRHRGSYDLTVSLNRELSVDQVREETNWLILCGDTGDRGPLVEDFGGYWPDQDLWTEEFIPGDTLERVLGRFARRGDEQERLRLAWPFLAWASMSAYVDFWDRTGRQLEIADPAMTNVVVPTHDYLSGTRIVSISNRRRYSGVLSMLSNLWANVIEPAEREHERLRGVVGRDIVCASLLEIVGESEGMTLLAEATEQARAGGRDETARGVERFVAGVEREGFRPMRLFFAARRYRRWTRLSGEYTPLARARTLQELYETYRLGDVAQAHPEVRVRFFRDTVFAEAPPALVERLDELIGRLRRRELSGEEVIEAVAELRAGLDLEADDDYFLARLSYPYLRPEDTASFVDEDRGGRRTSEMVVILEDHDGNPFRVRHAMNPKEVGKLHQLFLAAKLDVRFRPEHHFLVALNERNQIIGGIYYDVEKDGESAHLEKIVVADRYRRQGVADGLMKDFFNRMRSAGLRTVTTGFFRPEYFYAYGFKIEKRYAGLVKSLAPEEAARA